MPTHTQQSISGFIASDHQPTYIANRGARFYARIEDAFYTGLADDDARNS